MTTTAATAPCTMAIVDEAAAEFPVGDVRRSPAPSSSGESLIVPASLLAFPLLPLDPHFGETFPDFSGTHSFGSSATVGDSVQ